MKINNLDYHLYQGIQQKLIDALDEGEAVYIKGAGENRTEMYVQLWQPADGRRRLSSKTVWRM